jgi:transposase-like protein
MMLFVQGQKDALLKLVCPHCKAVQQRARKPHRCNGYACTRCKRHFTRAEGQRGYKRTR